MKNPMSQSSGRLTTAANFLVRWNRGQVFYYQFYSATLYNNFSGTENNIYKMMSNSPGSALN